MKHFTLRSSGLYCGRVDPDYTGIRITERELSGRLIGHSFRSLSYEASSPQSAMWCFLFQFPVSSPFLKVIQ
jgi:hypothetical protein